MQFLDREAPMTPVGGGITGTILVTGFRVTGLAPNGDGHDAK
jgi:hypothetical protein